MIIIDLQKMQALNETLYTSATKNAFGDNGCHTLRHLLNGIVHIYRRLDPSLRNVPLALFADATDTPASVLGTSQMLKTIGNLTHELDGACLGRVNPDNSMEIFQLDSSTLMSLSQSAVVYYYNGGIEKFIIRGTEYRLNNPVVGYASVFCKPTFSNLAAALDDYRLKSAANTSCAILKAVWNETTRWFFKAKPEHIMRRSLNQYLQNVLNDAEVRPEQNVDETHPVDIHVTFSLTDHRAIIEIKWLGDSVDDTGTPTTTYRPARALEGAKQLAEYLDASSTWGPGVKTRGYLVVFDARRKGLSQGMTALAPTDALHYRDSEINYQPDYSTNRQDFHTPIRMYMFPATA